MVRLHDAVLQGVAGIFLGASRRRERVFVRCRKGFIKLAMQTGVGVLPAPSHYVTPLK